MIDHLVIHTDKELEELRIWAESLKPQGFFCDLARSRKTPDFEASYLYIGSQYLEIVKVLNTHGNAWQSRWVERFTRGERGAFCLFLRARNLDEIYQRLQSIGLPSLSPPERTSFEINGATRLMPWRLLLLPAIPRTNLEIAFIEYDKGVVENYRQFMQPNSESNGITEIIEANVRLPLKDESVSFLQKISPGFHRQKEVYAVAVSVNRFLQFENSGTDAEFVNLKAVATNEKFIGCKFSIQNVEVEVVSAQNNLHVSQLILSP